MADEKTSVQFTEEMKGYVALDPPEDYQDGFDEGRRQGTYCMFHLTIKVPDVDFFIIDPEERAEAEGYVECDQLGGKMPVTDGVFNLFVDADDPDQNTRHMQYHLPITDGSGRALTLRGHKVIKDNGVFRIWHDTTTLYTELIEGHPSPDDDSPATVVARGILHIYPRDFAKQLTTMRASGPDRAAEARGLSAFGKLFAGTVMDVYGAGFLKRRSDRWRVHEVPMYTLEGVKRAEITTSHFTTGDDLGLDVLRFRREASRDVVVLFHGLTTSTDMYIMPEHYNLVSYLLDHGFGDVWSVYWRGSNRHSYDLFPNRYNIDDVALYDMPGAIATVREAVGPDARIHVIAHCVGSLGFNMALFSGIVDGISSVISNSVALVPQVPRWSYAKLRVGPMALNYILRYPNVNPRWSYLSGPGIARGKPFAKMVSLFHRECKEPACHMVSFMWGAGHPACYQHENLADVTHRRVGDLFGAVNTSYYRHIAKMVRRGVAVKMNPTDSRYNRLPNSYLDRIDEVDLPPMLLVTGDQNKVFTDSNIVFHESLPRLKPGIDAELKVYPGYGHQDVFQGVRCDEETFPAMLDFLNRHRGAPPSRGLAATSSAGAEQ